MPFRAYRRTGAAAYQIGAATQANLRPFFPIIGAMTTVVPGKADWNLVVAIGRFLGFAYTYHYLNWFSKTGIIGWHSMSRSRMAVIGVLYAVSLGIYAYDYRVGLLALYLLSVTHVFLEFPLDARTIVDVTAGAFRDQGRARPSTRVRRGAGARREPVAARR
jgi:hypothetical protein